MRSQQTLLDFSTAGPIAEATPPTVVKVAMTRFLLLSYKRALRAPNNSTESQIEGYDQDIDNFTRKMNNHLNRILVHRHKAK